MSSAIFLQQVEHEGPGRIVPIFRDFGIPCEVRHLYRGDEAPTDLDEIRVLVVLGGPMGVADVDDPRYPFLRQELALLKRMVEQDRAVLGICLGAQLLAAAAGAKVYPNVKPGATPDAAATPMPEIGWGPVSFPFPGGTDPLVFGLADGSPMFHWHFDTFDLPKLPPPPNHPANAPPPPTGCQLLSSSARCRHQAFRFRNRLVGFQYHFEFTEGDIERLLSADGETLRRALGNEGEARIRDETVVHYRRYARLGERLVGNFVQFLKAY